MIIAVTKGTPTTKRVMMLVKIITWKLSPSLSVSASLGEVVLKLVELSLTVSSTGEVIFLVVLRVTVPDVKSGLLSSTVVRVKERFSLVVWGLEVPVPLKNWHIISLQLYYAKKKCKKHRFTYLKMSLTVYIECDFYFLLQILPNWVAQTPDEDTAAGMGELSVQNSRVCSTG